VNEVDLAIKLMHRSGAKGNYSHPVAAVTTI
jgi:hypothetical protein